jgi:endonuclease YncB( thermonuclease family)
MKTNFKTKILLFLVGIFGVIGLVGCDNGGTTLPEKPGTPYTDGLKLTREYEGKDFLTDGIGVVQLASPVDGDSAIFRSGSKSFQVRFLAIDAPESTYRVEPWGEKAALFTKTKLMQAKEIVLESEGEKPEKDSNDRYLAWVWVEGRLLNLVLVEESYSSTKGLSGSKYEQVFYDADLRTQKFKLRIWSSQPDPDFDYSRQGIEVSIAELRDVPKGRKVRIQGIVSRVYGYGQYQQAGGYSAYVQEQDENGKWHGVYVYGGFSPITGFKPGHIVVIEGKTGDHNGVFQITDIKKNSQVQIIGMGHELEPIVLAPSEVKISNKDIVNLLVEVQGLTLSGNGYTSDGGGYTVYTKEGVDIRIDGKVNLFDNENNRIKDHEQFIAFIGTGVKFNIIGPVSEYNNRYQIMLTDLNDIQYLN